MVINPFEVNLISSINYSPCRTPIQNLWPFTLQIRCFCLLLLVLILSITEQNEIIINIHKIPNTHTYKFTPWLTGFFYSIGDDNLSRQIYLQKIFQKKCKMHICKLQLLDVDNLSVIQDPYLFTLVRNWLAWRSLLVLSVLNFKSLPRKVSLKSKICFKGLIKKARYAL